jgi:transcriptional regulator with XRE-family HTH domain
MSHTTQADRAPAPATQRPDLDFDGQAGAALHQRRRRLGLTATEVARRVGITQRQMARLELGIEPLTLRLALGLGAALGMPPGWYLGLDAAALPEAIGISLDTVHEDWARSLIARMTATAGGEITH